MGRGAAHLNELCLLSVLADSPLGDRIVQQNKNFGNLQNKDKMIEIGVLLQLIESCRNHLGLREYSLGDNFRVWLKSNKRVTKADLS